uniref:Uncharacterized protein n=1 Tax=viral metagenome TaxID=1070528 RepID=A0A6C0I9I4_9ZZZZ
MIKRSKSAEHLIVKNKLPRPRSLDNIKIIVRKNKKKLLIVQDIYSCFQCTNDLHKDQNQGLTELVFYLLSSGDTKSLQQRLGILFIVNLLFYLK